MSRDSVDILLLVQPPQHLRVRRSRSSRYAITKKLPHPQAGSRMRIPASFCWNSSSFREFEPVASDSAASRSEKRRTKGLEDVGFARVVRTGVASGFACP